MKMMSKTSMTSTSGVTLISLFRSSPPPPVFMPMAGRSSLGLRLVQEVALDDVQVFLLERFHLAPQDANSAHEIVVRHDRRDRRYEADRRRQQRFCDRLTHRIDRRI